MNGGPHSTERLDLARLRVDEASPLMDVLQRATSISARALGVARVGVWLFADDHRTLRCLYTHVDGEKSPATPNIVELHGDEYPSYLQALATHRWVNADDAQNDPATRELKDGYLVPLGITSMLDAPILSGEVLLGVVCHEHVGPKRIWCGSDRAFAGSVADIVGLFFEQQRTLETERRLRMAEIERSEGRSLETLGRISLGIAHDVNNVLSAIGLAAADLARSAAGSPSVETIQTATRTGAGLTRALFRFARSQGVERGPMDLVDAVRSVEPLIKAIARRSQLVVVAPAESVMIRAAPSDIHQLLLNLVSNADRAAANTGGHVEVSVHIEDRRACLCVSDTGAGISDELRARIFEPFVSTREHGTGWGLVTVRRIADELGATIEIDSSPGAGTKFKILFALA